MRPDHDELSGAVAPRDAGRLDLEEMDVFTEELFGGDRKHARMVAGSGAPTADANASDPGKVRAGREESGGPYLGAGAGVGAGGVFPE